MYIDRLVLIFILGSYFLSPTIMEWARQGGIAWYRPYLIWLLLIGIAFLITRSRDADGL